MSEPVVEDLINFTFSQTDNSSMGLPGNSRQLYETSNHGNDFDIDLNETFDLNKYNRQIKASSRTKTVLEPFNKNSFEFTDQVKNAPRKSPEVENLDCLESDESLGILPDLLNDEMTVDFFKTEMDFSDEIFDGINPQTNENPASFVLSPSSDSQFNRISLFLKNISTPLPTFGNDRRLSSTPKISVANITDIEHYSSPHFLPDEKEEPIIAGSCQIKFETDFNLDDLKNVKPLTSTYKLFSPLQFPSILNEETDLKSEVDFKKLPKKTENNLNVTQTFNHNVEDLFPCEHEGNIQNENILNNTFQIKQSVFVELDDPNVLLKQSIPSTMKINQAGSNNHNEKEKVKTLDSTFAIPGDEINCNIDCEKTFIIDFDSAIGRHVPTKSNNKGGILNETHVLEVDSTEFCSKQQVQIANVTFTKDIENDTQTTLKHLCYSSHGAAFKPQKQILEETFSRNDFEHMKPILEETFSENDLNEMKAHSKNSFHCRNSISQSASPEAFNIKAKVNFSEKVVIISETKVTENGNYPIEFASPNSPKMLVNDILPEVEKIFHDQINPAENENNLCDKASFQALQSFSDVSFSEEMRRTDQESEKCDERDSTEIANSIIEHASKALTSTTFSKEGEEKICFHEEMNLAEYENISNKMFLSVPLQSIRDATFSEINEGNHLEIDKFHRSNSTETVNSIIEHTLPKALASITFNKEIGGKNYLRNQIGQTENEYHSVNKMSHSDPLQSNGDTVISENTIEKYDIKTDKFLERNSIQNENSGELASFILPKISKSLSFPEDSNIFQSSAIEDSNELNEQSALNSQPILSRKIAYSLNFKQCTDSRIETKLPKAIKGNIFTGNSSGGTKFCTRSNSKGNCSFDVLHKSSNTSVSTSFSENNAEVRNDIDSISNENDQVQISQNSLSKMINTTFEKTGEIQIESISIPTENDKFQTSPKEIANSKKMAFVEKDIKVQSKIQITQYNQNSPLETTSLNLTKSCLKGTPSRKVTDKLNSSLKRCLSGCKSIVKSGLIKPTNIVYPRKIAEQGSCQLPIAKPLCKPIISKGSITSDLNRTLNLCGNSTDKSFPKDFNRRTSLSYPSASSTDKSKCIDFKKPLGIPSKLGINRPESNFQKSSSDAKYSNGNLKDIKRVNDKQHLQTQPDLISGKDPKIIKSVAVASVKAKGPVSSRFSFHEKLSLKYLKMRECGLKSNTDLAHITEKSTNEVIDLPKRERVYEIGIKSANFEKNYSKHSIATNLPRTFLSSNNPNKSYNSKLTVIKQKSAPVSNSSKPDSLKFPGSLKLPNSNVKLKFSSLPKAQSDIKISTTGSESKSIINKRLSSVNQKSNGYLMKSCIPEGEAVQFVETQINSDCLKPKDNIRENIQQISSIFPPSREQAVQPLNPLKVKKSNGQCNFLPMPKIIKSDIRRMNSNDTRPAKESERQNQVCRRTSGKLPQLRRIPAPGYNK